FCGSLFLTRALLFVACNLVGPCPKAPRKFTIEPEGEMVRGLKIELIRKSSKGSDSCFGLGKLKGQFLLPLVQARAVKKHPIIGDSKGGSDELQRIVIIDMLSAGLFKILQERFENLMKDNGVARIVGPEILVRSLPHDWKAKLNIFPKRGCSVDRDDVAQVMRKLRVDRVMDKKDIMSDCSHLEALGFQMRNIERGILKHGRTVKENIRKAILDDIKVSIFPVRHKALGIEGN